MNASSSTTIPESRDYVHQRCRGVTTVDNGHFRGIANPTPGVSRTFCAACGEMFPIEEFAWQDTGESIRRYYERYQAKLSPSVIFVSSRMFLAMLVGFELLIGIVLGVLLSGPLGSVVGIAIGASVALMGSFVSLFVWNSLGERQVTQALGVTDVRQLR